MIVVDLTVSDLSQGHVAVGFVQIGDVQIIAFFRQDDIAAPQESGFAKRVLLFDSASERIVTR